MYTTRSTCIMCSVQSTLHSHNVHYTKYIYIHCTKYVQCTVYNVYYKMYNVQCIMYSVQGILQDVQCTVCNVQCTMYTSRCTMYNVFCKMYNVQFILLDIQCTMHIVSNHQVGEQTVHGKFYFPQSQNICYKTDTGKVLS